MAILRLITAILLLPLAFSAVAGVGNVVVRLGNAVTDTSLPFWIGIAGYFVFQVVLFKPLRTYVFGHELTHAIAGLLSGARLKGFSVGKDGGSVVLDKTNIVTILAPYFVPLYTVIVILAWWVAGLFWQVSPYRPWLIFFIGFTLSFHLALTAHALMHGQSDLEHFGPFFSGVLIALINCFVIVALLKFVFPSLVGLQGYFFNVWRDSAGMYGALYRAVAFYGKNN